MSTLYFQGNTYIFGATAPKNIGTGTVNYNFTGLIGNKEYKFIIVSKNALGFSGIVGPINIRTTEVRPQVNVFAWTHPAVSIIEPIHERSYSVRNTNNLISPSQATSLTNLTNLEKPYYDGAWGDSVSYFNINGYSGEISSQKGFTAPDGSTSATRFQHSPLNGGNYFITLRNISRNQREEYIKLEKGNTYYLSFWRDITRGATRGGLGTRIHDGPNGQWATTPPEGPRGAEIQQIEPVLGPKTSGDGTYVIPAGLTGWQRFVFTIYPNTGFTYSWLNLSLIAGSPIAGATTEYYFWGAQLELKASGGASEYAPNIISNVRISGSRYDEEGNLTFDGSPENLPTWGSSRGFTYFWPLITLWNDTNYDMKTLHANNYDDFYIRRAADMFKLLPKNTRSLRPYALESSFFFWTYEDAITGATYTSTDGLAVYEYWKADDYTAVTSANAYVGAVWPVTGISAGITSWNRFLHNFSTRGGTVDNIFFDNEFIMYATLFVEKGNTAHGWTAARKIAEDPRYSQPWNGITSLKSMMDAYGATLINMPDAYYNDPNHLAWSRAMGIHRQKAYDLVMSPAVNTYFPEMTISNYESFYQPEGYANWSYDQASNTISSNSVIGNASSPTLYGDVWINWFNGLNFIPLEDPTRLERFALTGGPTVPVSIFPRVWIAFVRSMLMLRCSKQARPDVPLTPWIGNVNWAFLGYNTTTTMPTAAWANIALGYDAKSGITLTQEPGNSAYYYEFIRHALLNGTRAFGYFNPDMFYDMRVPGASASDSPSVMYRKYMLSGATFYLDEIRELDNTIDEVHKLTGGFTLTTADTSRPNWLAPYFASGAPNLNGITWWWRVTVGSTYTINVQGITLSGISGPWGTWVSTTGPTLGNITITII